MSDIHDNTLTETSADGGVRDDDALRLTISPLPILPRSPRRSWRSATGAASLATVLVISLLAGLHIYVTWTATVCYKQIYDAFSTPSYRAWLTGEH